MKDNASYKNEALAALKGNWAPSVLAVLVFMAVVIALMAPYLIKSLTLTDTTDLEAAKGLLGWFWVYFLGLILVGFPLMVGLVNSFKKLLTTGENHVTENEFKIGFGNWLHHTWGYLLRSIFTFLWALLFLIPGIVKSLSYAMSNYILADYPELSAYKAIKLSQEMMDGHKYDLFYLYLGFVGWYILAIFTLGIGFFWLIPYVQTAQASFYQDVKAEWEARHAIA